MCTVSLLPDLLGFRIAMNRDETLDREKALAPTLHTLAGRRALYPSEAGGGTWIAVDEGGIVYALLNGHPSQPIAPRSPKESRGTLIPSLLRRGVTDRRCFGEVTGLCQELAPFRLLRFSRRTGFVRELVWDGCNLGQRLSLWHRQHWFSSSRDEADVVEARAAACERFFQQPHSGRASLRKAHSQHGATGCHLSVCMHRDDARTVSYTEVVVRRTEAVMAYCPDSPCQGTPVTRHPLKLSFGA